MRSQSMSQGTNVSAMSMDAVFVLHYMEALKELQKTWLDSKEDVDTEHFNLQVEYLIRLIPDEDTQNMIQKERVDLQTKYTKDNIDHPSERAGLIVITHLIKFICTSFDLLHIDITGPATSRQYRDSLLEIPDYEESDQDISAEVGEQSQEQPVSLDGE